MSSQKNNEIRVRGTAVSRGIGIGRAVFIDQTKRAPVLTRKVGDVDQEVRRYEEALGRVRDDLTRLAGSDDTGIFGVHLLILEDAFSGSIAERIRADGVSAEDAIRSSTSRLAERQRSVANEHIREKYLDIHDVADRLIKALDEDYGSELPTGAVYVVEELTASRMIELAASDPRAIVSMHGGWTSHTSILAREFRIPMVTGIGRLMSEDDIISVNGFNGEIVIRPQPDTLKDVQGGVLRDPTFTHDTVLETETADGVEICVRVNANLPKVYDRARREGACGIGLYRSEVLFDKNERFPDEETQFQAYREIATLTGSAGVRIRTFDVGIDRMPNDPRHGQKNPALGLRAVRLSLSDTGPFRTQIRAILRAACDRNADIVLPMVSGVGDVLKLRDIIEYERRKLISETTPVGTPRIGLMIETPSAVMTAGDLAEVADFFCLGTNDLVQYLLAVDRDEPGVAEWYQTLHPAVLKAVSSVINVANALKVPVTVCGEMAGSPFYVPLLIGFGARELSMNVNWVSHVRSTVAEIDIPSCEKLARAALTAKTTEDVSAHLTDFYKAQWPFILAFTNL